MPTSVGRVGAVTAGASILVLLGGVGGAVAGSMVTSATIKNETIQARDIAPGGVTRSEVRDGTLGRADLSTRVQSELAQRAQDGTDGVAGLESDGARPGATQLSEFPGNGANSTAVWTAGPAGQFHTSWVACPAGKTALGGGYSRDTDTGAAVRGLQVVTSSPAQIDPTVEDNPNTAADERVVYTPITGDPAGSFVPNGWLVEGFNNGNTDLIVRPWVICAAVNN
jgi:hypothetical protein